MEKVRGYDYGEASKARQLLHFYSLEKAGSLLLVKMEVVYF